MEETKDSAPSSPSYSLEALASGDSHHLPDLHVKLETDDVSSLPSPSSMRDSDDEAENDGEGREDRKPVILASSPSSSASQVLLADSPPRSSLLIPTLLNSTPLSLDASDDVQVVKEVITIDSGSEDDDEDFDDDDDDSSSSSSLGSSSSSLSGRGYRIYRRFSTDEGEETDNNDHESEGWPASSNADDDDDDSSSASSSSRSTSSSAPAPPTNPLHSIPFYEFPGFPSVHNLHQLQSEWMMNAHDQMRRASSAAGVLPATYSFTSAFPHTTLHPSSSTSMSPHHPPSSSSSSSSVPIPVSSPSTPPSPISLSPPPLPSAASPSFFHFPSRDVPIIDRRDHWTTDPRPSSSSTNSPSSSTTSPSTSSSRMPTMIPTMTPMGVPMPFTFPSRPATMTTTTTTTRRMSPMDFPHFMPSFGPPTPMVPHPFIDLSSDQPPEFVQLTSTSISSFSPFNHPSFPFVHMPPGPPHLFLHPHSHPHVHTHSRDHSHRRHHHHHRPHTTVHARPLPHALHQLQFRDISSEDYEMLRMMEASSGSSSAGAPQRKIQSLPVSKVTEEESGKHACCICLDDMLKDDMVKRLPCGHYFHQKCIDEWLQTKQECPLDKKNPFASVRK